MLKAPCAVKAQVTADEVWMRWQGEALATMDLLEALPSQVFVQIMKQL